MIKFMRRFYYSSVFLLIFQLVFSANVFGLKLMDLPPAYNSIFTPVKNKLEGVVKRSGGNFRAILSYSVAGGTRYVELVDPDFLSFYEKLYKQVGGKIKKVSIKVVYKGRTIPYNPFYQIWDDYGTRLITFSSLRPGCVQPILELKAEAVRGIRIVVPFQEVKKLFFDNRGREFYYPTHYCY